MKESIIISLTLFLFGVFSSRYNSESISVQVLDNQQKSYEIKGDSICFTYFSSQKANQVYVIGNFMNWQENHPAWKMKFDTQQRMWYLNIPLTQLKQFGLKFYEFTFLVNDKYVDTPANAPNVIHCVGYGNRYIIAELNQ